MGVGSRQYIGWVFALALTSSFARIAAAQSTPTADDDDEDEDDAIEVAPTAAPRPTAASPVEEPAPPPVAEPEDEDEEDDAESAAIVTVVTRGVDPRTAIEQRWHRHLGVGVTVGAGSMLGLFGAFVEADLHPVLAIQLGGGAGGTFGPALGAMVIGRPIRWGLFAPYAGFGFSTNFIPDAYHADPSLLTPANAYWLNFELGTEFRLPMGFALRGGVGWNALLNTGEFSNRDFDTRYGPLANTQLGWDPVSAADAHDEGHPLGFPYAHFDLVYLLPF